MGIMLCSKHGKQQGPMCCRHVLDAAMARPSAPASRPSLIRFDVDLLNDGGELLDFVICQDCADDYGLSAKMVLPWEYFDKDKLPWTAPVCARCLAEFTGTSNVAQPTSAPDRC